MQILRNGSRDGDGNVATLQATLNAFGESELAELTVDGIFGDLTEARTREFQGLNRLTVDGVVGPQTSGALGLPKDNPDRCECANGSNGSSGIVDALRSIRSSIPVTRSRNIRSTRFAASPAVGAAPEPNLSFGAQMVAMLLSSCRGLNDDQRSAAKMQYGDSIDLKLVLLTNFVGFQDRPFTFTLAKEEFPDLNKFFGTLSFISAGSFTPSRDILIHELAHVWQAQHHPVAGAYMANSVLCQRQAHQENLAELPAGATPSPLWVKLGYPFNFPHSAYAYKLGSGRTFGSYNSEQVANQAENGVSDILTHMKSFKPHDVDPANVSSMTRIQTENRLAKDVDY
jgi:hypothetical protein